MSNVKKSPIEMTARYPHFDVSEELSAIWIKDDNEALGFFKTVLLDSLSLLFPEGERFFIRSVKNYQDRVIDPELKDEVGLFITQEGQHTREHYNYNQALKQRGYDIDRIDVRLKKRFAYLVKYVDRQRQLAATCATEHYTAVLGEALLNNPHWIENAPPKMQAVWTWHAIEEIEHKAVAFDVYKATVDNEFKRKLSFVITSIFLPFYIFMNMCHMFRKEKRLFDFKMWRAGLGFLFKRDGLIPQIWPKLKVYLKKDFHPWDEDNSELVERWRNTYEAEAGQLKPAYL